MDIRGVPEAHVDRALDLVYLVFHAPEEERRKHHRELVLGCERIGAGPRRLLPRRHTRGEPGAGAGLVTEHTPGAAARLDDALRTELLPHTGAEF